MATPTENGIAALQQEILDVLQAKMANKPVAVIIADDQRAIRLKIASDIMKCDPSILVYPATNGLEALQWLDEIRTRFHHDPAFIILDLDMPVMDGWTVIEHLRDEYTRKGLPGGIPIIVFSGMTGDKRVSLFRKTSIHDTEKSYAPLVTISKENGMQPYRYMASGEQSLIAWIKTLLNEAA
jgi:CheY-like chemotaxis protein